MPGSIVLFGATGYTGRLVAAALVRRGARPTLAARNAQALEALAAELGGLDTAVADVSRPESVSALVSAGDVLVSTVGPFVRWGAPPSTAASPPARATSTPPVSRRSSATCSSARTRPHAPPAPGS